MSDTSVIGLASAVLSVITRSASFFTVTGIVAPSEADILICSAFLSLALTAGTNASDALTATPAHAAAKVEVSYQGKNVVNGTAVKWTADGSAHPVTITVKNGNAVKVYTVNVTKSA